MKKLDTLLKKRKTIAFLDLEGTQLTHEIIEVGLVKVTLNPDNSIKKEYKGLKLYVLPKSHVGSVVTHLTGITDSLVKREGIHYSEAISKIKGYMGEDYEKCIFMVYGNQDAAMFINTYKKNMETNFEDSRFLASRCIDMSKFFQNYFSGKNGNPISLEKLCEKLEVKYRGKAHDALTDAYALLDCYKAFLSKSDLVKKNYKLSLSEKTNYPYSIRRVINELNNGNIVTPKQFEEFISGDLK